MKSLMKIGILALALMAGVTVAHGQTWNLQVVDDAGDAGYDSQVVVANDGTPFIFYKTSGNAMFVAWWVSDGGGGGGWQYASLETQTPTGYAYEVLVDAQGRFHIAYAKTSAIRYGIFSPVTKTWVLGPESVTSFSGYYHVDLALTTIGPDIIPVVSVNQDGNKVYVCKRDPANGTWSFTLIDNLHLAGRASSVAVDSLHKLHVCFYENSGQNLMYATKTWDDTTWQVSTVDITGNVGEYGSIAVTPNDQVHIVYYDATNGDLKYAALNP
jgi:hypothetical protein